MITIFAPARIGGMRTHTKRQRRSVPGIQHLWGFDNGHLASVVRDAKDNHLWQVAVLDGSGRLNYKSPISTDVIGALRPTDVRRILRQIEALK